MLVVDEGRPANAVSQGVGGLLGHDRVKPAQLRRDGRRQLEGAPNVVVRNGAVEDVEPALDGFVVTLSFAGPVRARAIVLATGAALRPAAATRDRAGGGRSVFQCAFCDGWATATGAVAARQRTRRRAPRRCRRAGQR